MAQLHYSSAAVRRFIHGFLLGAIILLFPSTVSYADYAVTAAVPISAPSHAAVIDPDLDGTTVRAALLNVTGTCAAQATNGVVSIWRGGAAIGSTACTGTFSMQIMLKPGVNTLMARSASVSGFYGPNSLPSTIILALPTTVHPPTPNVEPTTPAQIAVATNAAAISGLTAAASDVFSSMTSGSNAVSVGIVVGGGDRPYDITLNWGDGTVETHSVDQPGNYVYTHTYITVASYHVKGHVQDVLGSETVFDYMVVSPETSGTTASGQSISATKAIMTNVAASQAGIKIQLTPRTVLIAVVGTGVFLASSYTWGWRRAQNRYLKFLENERVARSKSQIIRKRTQP